MTNIKKFHIYYEKVELTTNITDFKLSKIDIKVLKISDDKEKKIYLLQFGENYLSNMGILRVIHPSKIAMSKIKFATFGHKSVIFDFKKLWGLVDFVVVHTGDKAWVNHKFTSFMPSITYCNQNIIHLAYHSDFFIYLSYTRIFQ